jgi:hypothetical protein
MMDYVAAVCSDCGGTFHTWLSRGEVAAALCLGCWWKQPRATKPPPADGAAAGRPGQILDPEQPFEMVEVRKTDIEPLDSSMRSPKT